MKRKITAGIVTLALVALMVPVAFAASDDTPTNTNPKALTTQNQEFFDRMFDKHKNWLDQAVKDGQVTEDQAKAWSQHFDQMKEFHKENGMGPMMNGSMMNMMGNGSCMGMGSGMMGNFNAPAYN